MSPLEHNNISTAAEWPVIQKSAVAKCTTNPIRNVVDRLQIPPNPDLSVISLGLGDPTIYGNLETPKGVTDAMIEALLHPRNHGYPPATGSDVSKAAIAKRYSTPQAPLKVADVVVASGCSGALEMAIAALCSPGQTILLPQPGFSLYRTLCDNKGINVLYYRLLPDKGWEIDLQHVKELVESDSSVVAWLVNNPSNPCGSVYSKEHLEACKRLAAQNPQLTLIADEIYEDMVFKPNIFHPLASIQPLLPMLTCGGLAKRFLVPGWRLGWCLIHDPSPGQHAMPQIRQALVDLAGLILGANSLVQAALPDIFENVTASQHQKINDYLARNAQTIYEGLRGVPGLKLIKPQGAFYMMLGLDMHHFDFKDDVEACEKLISEQSIIALPGMIFGMPDFIRLVYCASPEKITEAVERIKAFCATHYLS